MNAPPTSGPSAIGTRRTSECNETPIVRLFFGNTRATRLIVAGSEIAVHDRNNTAPPSTAGHVGINTTIKKPIIGREVEHEQRALRAEPVGEIAAGE